MDKTVLDSSGYESDIENCHSTDFNGPPRNRRRRDRTQFTDAGLQRLEEVFKIDRYPDVNVREALADELGVTEDRIQVWFQNRRSKHRRRLHTSNISSSDISGEKRATRANLNLNINTILNKQHMPPITNMATVLNPWNFPFMNGLTLPPFVNPASNGILAKIDEKSCHKSKNKSNSSESGSLDLSSSSGSTRPDTPLSETESSKVNNESSIKDEHDKNTKKHNLPAGNFKRPWEASASSSTANRSVTEPLNIMTPLSLPLQIPPFMLAAPPVLPFSPLGNPGTGILFLPSSLAPITRDMYHNF